MAEPSPPLAASGESEIEVLEEEGLDEDVNMEQGNDNQLEDQFEGLQLYGEEEDDLDLSEEVVGLIKEVRWLGIFRVHTTKPFCHVALFK